MDQARQAFKEKSIDMSKQAHAQKQKEHLEKHRSQGEYLKSIVYGGLDGIITTFAVIIGAYSADLGKKVIMVIGISTLIADAISMALGDYLSTKSEKEFEDQQIKIQDVELINNPREVKQKMINDYINRAYRSIIIAEQLNIDEKGDDEPIKNALITFFSFLIFGFFKLIPFLVAYAVDFENYQLTFIISCIVAFFSLVMLGSLKSNFTNQTWYFSSIETVFVGAFAVKFLFQSLIAFVISFILKPLNN